MKITATYIDIMRGDNDGEMLVRAGDKDGREYIFPRTFTPAGAAEFYCRLTDAEYKIDTARWEMRIPYGSNAWLMDGMEERTIEDEKMGLLGV